MPVQVADDDHERPPGSRAAAPRVHDRARPRGGEQGPGCHGTTPAAMLTGARADDDVERPGRQAGPAAHPQAAVAAVARPVPGGGPPTRASRPAGRPGPPTRAAASASRSSGRRPSRTASTIARRHASTISSSCCAARDAHGVRARGDGERRGPGRRPRACDGGHVEGVGDDEAGEAEAVTQQPHGGRPTATRAARGPRPRPRGGRA